ncbi:hypothetical protein [Arthrobacter sp. SLBN-53]|uniref:hypothetical protein n=1 Tax=Arthrobacter sp. SLBN-53 TaxID=2768412 RepID=UPI00115299F3|nr:hypothetical protein [Arthrobacter sp. SLBN-53]TQK27056.1 hypothetical protein FBY28_0003 [Arthrobacter sp. SLBN-53]
MRRNGGAPLTTKQALSAVTSVAALLLSGCADQPGGGPDAQSPAPAPTSTSSMPFQPPAAALPAPEALTEVLGKLADPSIPGAQKVALVQFATPEDAAALDRFAKATVDAGLAPLTFQAADLSWADGAGGPGDPGDVVATVTVAPANPIPGAAPFTFPMQFTLHDGAWQLTRDTADQLLELQAQNPLPPAPQTPPR